MKRFAFRMITFLVGLTLLGACAQSGAIEVGTTAPDFKLTDIDGKQVSLSDFKGKIVILNFFASWCPPCRSEVPDFVELEKAYEDKGLVIVGVSLVNLEESRDFAAQFGINYPVLVDDGKASNIYGPIRSIPATFIITKDFKIAKMYIGARSKSVFENDIKELLK